MQDNSKKNPTDTKKILAEKLDYVSSGPGIYLMKNNKGVVIYAGKAKNLKKRLTSYFKRSEYNDLKTGILVHKIVDFETIVTRTEQEALILEANLIRKYKPRYNVILKDDKKYPSLRINIKEDYPNITIHRKVTRDGALYFGPYSSAAALHQTLKVINKTFKIRKCKSKTFKNRSRPCINYQIGLCLAPCCFPVSREKYHAIIREITLFLKGRTPELIQALKKEMSELASGELFEEAAIHRDKIMALEKIMEKQCVVNTDMVDRDVIAVTRGKELSLITVLSLTGGVMSGSRHFPFKETMSDDQEVVETFIRQYYETAPNIPKEILTQYLSDDVALLESWLGGVKESLVRVLAPKRGAKVRLLEMAVKNGKKELKERIAREHLAINLLIRLRDTLNMDRLPEYIECFDNSNISGTEPVAAMVVFKNGLPYKSGYRKFTIKNSEIQDDYAYMEEILTRRYRHDKEDISFPDLLIVDGGKGQLNIAINVLKTLGIFGQFDVIGIAKKDEKKGEEYDKIYKPYRANPVMMPKDGKVLLLLQRIRDEAHRFAITFHRLRRNKKTTLSVLDGIPGIGPKRKKALLSNFGSVKAIQCAGIHELIAVDGMSKTAAETVFNVFNKNGDA